MSLLQNSKYELELLCDVKNILGEGPFYNFLNRTISFIDIVSKKLYIMDESKNIKEVLFEEKIGASIPFGNDSYLAFGETNIFLYQNDMITTYLSLDSIVTKGMRCNDAKGDRHNRIYFSTMVDDGISKPHGGFYCLSDKKIICLDTNTKLGNGLAWNSEDTKLYYADSIEHKVFSYDYDSKTGLISNKKVLFEIKDGAPDGMTIDGENNLYVAIWGGGRIEKRSSIDGSLLDIINIPTKLVTSCYFIDDFNLVVTTAKLDQEDEYAGCVFLLKFI